MDDLAASFGALTQGLEEVIDDPTGKSSTPGRRPGPRDMAGLLSQRGRRRHLVARVADAHTPESQDPRGPEARAAGSADLFGSMEGVAAADGVQGDEGARVPCSMDLFGDTDEAIEMEPEAAADGAQGVAADAPAGPRVAADSLGAPHTGRLLNVNPRSEQ